MGDWGDWKWGFPQNCPGVLEVPGTSGYSPWNNFWKTPLPWEDAIELVRQGILDWEGYDPVDMLQALLFLFIQCQLRLVAQHQSLTNIKA